MKSKSTSHSPILCIKPGNIIIKPFQPVDQAEVKNLILAGLVEHWGWLDPDKNPDLNDVQASYAKGVFLVARYNSKIIGTGAFLPRSDEIAEILRMSVAWEHRRQGVGRLVLKELIQLAQKAGFNEVILETTQTWEEVIQFYLNCGFRICHYRDGDVYFALDL